MSKDEGSTKPECRRSRTTTVRHLIIRHPFELRHSDLVILAFMLLLAVTFDTTNHE